MCSTLNILQHLILRVGCVRPAADDDVLSVEPAVGDAVVECVSPDPVTLADIDEMNFEPGVGGNGGGRWWSWPARLDEELLRRPPRTAIGECDLPPVGMFSVDVTGVPGVMQSIGLALVFGSGRTFKQGVAVGLTMY